MNSNQPPQMISPNSLPGSDASQPARKKRGRPRKNSPNNIISSRLSPDPVPSPKPSSGVSAGENAPVPDDLGGRGSEWKRGLRTFGTGKKLLQIFGRWECEPRLETKLNVISVATGEDIISRIRAFSLQGPHRLYIVSAVGAVTDAIIYKMSGSSVTFEGRSEIIFLEGFYLQESNGEGRRGVTTAYLAVPDGRLVGGIAQRLIAANPVKVTMFRFHPKDGRRNKTAPSSSPVPSPLNFAPPGWEREVRLKIKFDRLLVAAGEDIVSKVETFSPQGPQLFWTASAEGEVTDAVLYNLSGSSMTYEGRSQILSLEGGFSLQKCNDGRGRRGVMTAYLAGSDSRLISGIARSLIAANRVEVIMYHIHLEDDKEEGPSNDLLGVNGVAGSSHNMSMQLHQSQGNSTMDAHGKTETVQEIRINAQESLIRAQRELLQEKDDLILKLTMELKTRGEGSSSF